MSYEQANMTPLETVLKSKGHAVIGKHSGGFEQKKACYEVRKLGDIMNPL